MPVAICIPTYKRPKGLTRLLETIAALDFDRNCFQVVVVDNSDDCGAKPVVDAVMSTGGIGLSYVHETRRGIASARNRLVQEATKLGAEFIFFIDDDQTVEPRALTNLLKTARAFMLDNVKAQSVPMYDGSMPQWVIESGYFAQVPRPTGMPIRNFGANGVLLKLSAVNRVPGPFDSRFDLTGGEDGMFFAQFHALGFRSGGCGEAIVREIIPVSRGTRAWMLRRSYRAGLVKGMIVREVNPSIWQTIEWIILGGGYGLAHLPPTVWFMLRRDPRWVRNLANAGMGWGVLNAIVRGERALSYQEYRTIHGS